MPAIINAPSSAWFVLRDLAEGSDPKAPFSRPSPVGNVPTAAEIRGFYESLGPATDKLYMSGFDPSTYPLGEGWANRLSDNAWEAVVSAAELLNSVWSIGDTINGLGYEGAVDALSDRGDKLFNPAFVGISFTLPFIRDALQRAVLRYTSLETQTPLADSIITYDRDDRDRDYVLDPLLEYSFMPDRPYSIIVGTQSRTNAFEAILPTAVNSAASALIKLAIPDKKSQWGYAAPLNWWTSTLTPETIPLAQGISNTPNPSSVLAEKGLRVTWLDLQNTMAIGPHSNSDQARRLLTARWHDVPEDVRYILDALDTMNTIGGGDTIFARNDNSPSDEDVLNLIRTMGIYPPLIALPFEFKYKLSLFANQLRAGTPDLSEMIKDGLADTRWAYLTLFGPGLLTLLLSLRKANKFEEKIAKILNAVADMLFLAADPQAAINDTVGYLLCACLTFFRRATKLLSQSSGDLPPSVNELCRTMFGLTERQLEQMIRSLGSTSHQPLNATTGRLTDDDWGYPIRMDRVFTQTVLPTSNFDRSELIYPVYCIDYDLLSLPFKKSFEPLVYVSRWVVPGGENGPTDSVSAPHQIFDSKDAVATSSQIETAITDPTLQLIQTINLASLLLECGFEAEGFTGILSRFMASSGTVGYYVREFIGKQIAYSDANAMLNGFSISTVIRFLWRQMITDEFVAFFAQNYRNAETFSDVDAKLEWLWTVIPWMSTATRRRTIQQVMGVLDFDTAPTVIRDTKLERDIVIYGYRRIDVSDRLPDGSILYRLGGKESTESGTAFTRWQDLPRIDRDAFHLFMQEMAKSDQELVALAKQWKELRANPFRPSAWRVKDFEPLDVEPEEAEYIDPDRTMSGPQTPITLEQLIAMAFSATPEWSKP